MRVKRAGVTYCMRRGTSTTFYTITKTITDGWWPRIATRCAQMTFSVTCRPRSTKAWMTSRRRSPTVMSSNVSMRSHITC